MTNEEKAQEFLKFIAQNEKKLKKALMKNVTYNAEIVDEIFGETIIKVYKSILKNGTNIKDMEDYFFIALKWTYIYRDNQNREYNDMTIRNFNFNGLTNENEIYNKERNEEHKEILIKIRERLYQNFNEKDINNFYKYYKGKIGTRYSLKEFSEDYSLNEEETISIFKEIKNFLKNDEIIKELKRKI